MPGLDGAVTKLRLRRHGLLPHMRVFSHTTAEERFRLFQLARFLPANARALEIGSHLGSSALFLCAGLAPIGGHLICVDTWMNETMPDGSKDTLKEFEQAIRPFAHMITPVRKLSQDLTPADVGGALDLAFIDGDHSEAGVRSDFDIISPFIKHGGFLAFHDVSETYPGVTKVLGEALASGNWQLISFTDCLGVIKRL